MLATARACIIERGPGVSLSVLSTAIGLSPSALVKRFGSKAELVFLALLPTSAPRWPAVLGAEPGPEPVAVLRDVLVELCESFVEVGPALAALRMSDADVSRMFPPDEPGPSVRVRRLLEGWLRRAGVTGDVASLADAAVGAAEARGYLTWVGAAFVDARPTEVWATRLARSLLGEGGAISG